MCKSIVFTSGILSLFYFLLGDYPETNGREAGHCQNHAWRADPPTRFTQSGRRGEGSQWRGGLIHATCWTAGYVGKEESHNWYDYDLEYFPCPSYWSIIIAKYVSVILLQLVFMYMYVYPLHFGMLIRGEPEQAPNTWETGSTFIWPHSSNGAYGKWSSI